MIQALVLNFEAPLMSFGGVLVDQFNKVDTFPCRSMLTGLVANALGWSRIDDRAHQALQARLHYAARSDRLGTQLVDYQTVDFGEKGSMSTATAWTTWGALEDRKGGDAADGTHIRYRSYWADAVRTVVVTLEPADDHPTLKEVEDALRHPVRPLFLGRKCCVPSAPVLVGRTAGQDLRAILEAVPRSRRAGRGKLAATWARGGGVSAADSPQREYPRVEDRDWSNSIHVGRRIYVEGLLDPPEAS